MTAVELVTEPHRRQGEMYAGGPLDSVVELLAADIVWHVPGKSRSPETIAASRR